MINGITSTLIIGLLSFVAGFITGFVFRGIKDKRGDTDNNSIVLMIVTVIWALSMLVDIISPEYETSPLVHGLMGAIVGFFYKPFSRQQDKPL